MWEIPLIFLIISTIPETIVLTMLVFSLARIEYRIVPIATIGVILAIILYFIRKVPIYFGIHTIVAILTLAVMIYVYKRINFFRIITYAFFSMLTLLLLEFSFYYGINAIWPEFAEVVGKGNSIIRAMSTYPHIVIMLILALILNKKNKVSRNRWIF